MSSSSRLYYYAGKPLLTASFLRRMSSPCGLYQDSASILRVSEFFRFLQSPPTTDSSSPGLDSNDPENRSAITFFIGHASSVRLNKYAGRSQVLVVSASNESTGSLLDGFSSNHAFKFHCFLHFVASVMLLNANCRIVGCRQIQSLSSASSNALERNNPA
mmetsp:Transcript_24303/g.69882  ORF Transcript_24303/g.69882 Transcript_24303/m.69882 type:complete len:160 (+) Transcript_24303:1371-1850(+)